MAKSFIRFLTLQALFSLFFWISPVKAADSDLVSKLADLLWIIIPAGIFVTAFILIEKKKK